MSPSSVPRRALLSWPRRFLPQRVFGANDRVRIGVIGAGARQPADGPTPSGAEIVAVADCFPRRADEAASGARQWSIHKDHRSLLDLKGYRRRHRRHRRPPARPLLDSRLPGRQERLRGEPLTLYIAESRALVKRRGASTVFQVGSQQLMAMNRVACEFVRGGGLGKLLFVQGVNYTPPAEIPALAEQPVPEGLNWDLWLNRRGPTIPGCTPAGRGGAITPAPTGAHGMDQLQWDWAPTTPDRWNCGPSPMAPRVRSATPQASPSASKCRRAANSRAASSFGGERAAEVVATVSRPPADQGSAPREKSKSGIAQWQAQFHAGLARCHAAALHSARRCRDRPPPVPSAGNITAAQPQADVESRYGDIPGMPRPTPSSTARAHTGTCA